MRNVWLALALSLTARGAAAAEMSGPQLLRQSAAAYAALRSYAGTTTVRSAVTVGPRRVAQTATAVIRFQRPDKIRIEGKDVTGHPYMIVSDGHTIWSRPISRTNPGWQKLPILEMAIAGMTGVTVGAPSTVPAALLKLRWGNPFLLVDGSRRGPNERLEGHDCYKVVRADASITRTYWIDIHSFLLRGMKEEQNAQQLSALSRGAALSARVVAYAFTIGSINSPLSPKLFQR
jgi:hypothetical protein